MTNDSVRVFLQKLLPSSFLPATLRALMALEMMTNRNGQRIRSIICFEGDIDLNNGLQHLPDLRYVGENRGGIVRAPRHI